MTREKKCIGILTFHNAINYGAVLQAYALSKYIGLEGFECQVINYLCPGVERQYNYRRFEDCSSFKNFIAHNLTCFLRKRKKKNFGKFIKILPLSEEINKRDDLSAKTSKYRSIIVGSDQVFNPICSSRDLSFFLDFYSGGMKTSYGASMGSVEMFKKWESDALPLLKGFNSISTRERDAAQYLSEALYKECIQVVDPVWLLNRKEWERIAECPVKGDYIYVYNLDDHDELLNFSIELSEKEGLPIYSTNRTIMGDVKYFKYSKLISNCSPSQFVGLIQNAKYVVTDSFHATCFSIILNTEFYTCLNKKKDNTNSRIVLLLNQLGLRERIIDGEITRDSIDFVKAYSNVLPDLIRSKGFISNILKEANEHD